MTVSSSLRLQLLGWILVPLSALLAFNIWSSYSNARVTAGLVQDTALLASARSIAEQIRSSDGSVDVTIPPSAIERFSSPDRDRVVYRVAGLAGEILAGYPDVPDPPSRWRLEPQWYDGTFRGQPIRAVALGQPVAGEETRLAGVIVGQTLRTRDRMIEKLWRRTAWQESVMVVMAAVLALVGLRRGLTPLMRLGDAIRARGPRDLGRFDPAAVQTELKPVVLALNAAVDQIEGQIEQRRRFIADAAHQLRTPLTVMRTQAAVGRDAAEMAAKDEALAAVAATASDMSRVTNQLLMLAKAESEGNGAEAELVDLAGVVRTVLSSQAERALAGGRAIAVDAPKTPVLVRASPTLIAELVSNLLDNALRHTPPGTSVTARVRADGDGVEFLMIDTGPGIPAHERERVFERFYRISGSDVEGSGLGLAIVRTLVEAYGGRINLSAPDQGQGFVVRVWLPLADTTANRGASAARVKGSSVR